MKIKLSKSQWEEMGKKAGWLKTAGGYGRFSGDLSDILEAQVLIHGREGKNAQEIFKIIKDMIAKNAGLMGMVKEEKMTNKELLDLIKGNLEFNSEISGLM